MYDLRSIILFCCFISVCYTNECLNPTNVCESEERVPNRYILYDVNRHEGFNLRRDVYMRLAIFVKHLTARNRKHYYLVLPPWDNLPHWRSKLAGNQNNLPWGLFFNVNSLRAYVPVVEAYEFLENHPNLVIDHVLVLQHYQDLWNENFTWVNKWSVESCLQSVHYRQNKDNLYRIPYGSYWIFAKNVQCVSFQGPASLLEEVLNSFDGKSIFLHRAEVVLHDFFGDREYWKCRKSMQFSDELIHIASDFKKAALPVSTETVMTSYFTAYSSGSSSYYSGEPFLCVHFRRRDYKSSRAEHIPPIEYASSQIKEKLSNLSLNTVFVATDTDEAEFQKLRNHIQPFETVRFVPPLNVVRSYKDGGVAIIEQIVCSHARYFIGSYESTFSFRIQEERELLNFDPNTTFNRLCGATEENCTQPTRWLKVE